MIHPYLRSFTLAKKVVKEVCQIFKRGRQTVIWYLLQLHRITDKYESYYLFNKLYVDPFIDWIHHCNEEEVTGFGLNIEGLLVHRITKLSNATVMGNIDAGVGDANDHDLLGKAHLGLGLVELETSFFGCYDDKESSMTSEDDYESDSDSDSSGFDDEIVCTTAEKEEPPSCNKNQETTTSLSQNHELCRECLPGSNRVDTNHLSASLNTNIGCVGSISGVKHTVSESKLLGQKKKLIGEE